MGYNGDWLTLFCQVNPPIWFSVFTNWNFQDKGVCGYDSSQIILKLDKECAFGKAKY